jgi:hypothetical protein
MALLDFPLVILLLVLRQIATRITTARLDWHSDNSRVLNQLDLFVCGISRERGARLIKIDEAGQEKVRSL